MTQARKYAFDTEFAADGTVLHEHRAAPPPSAEALEAERLAAYERGKTDAVAQAEREAAAALQKLAAAATAALDRLEVECRSLRQEAAHTALIAARKIAGAALERYGADNAVAAIESAMDSLRQQPRLIIKLTPDAGEAVRARVEEMRAGHAYSGALLVRDDAKLVAGEVVIDWSDGVVSVSPADTANRIEALLEAALNTDAPGASP